MRWLTLACGLFAVGALSLYLLVAGHRADLSRMPDAVPSGPMPSAAAGAQAQPAPAAPPADAASAGATPGPADPLAAAVERLRAGLPAAGASRAETDAADPARGAAGTAADQSADAAPAAPDPATDEPAAAGDTAAPDTPSASSADALAPPVRAGQHVTALGVHWTLSVDGDRPSLVIHLGDGQDARVEVAPEFLALNLHAMSRNVENVRFLIVHDYLGRPGDYLFTPDGKLARL